MVEVIHWHQTGSGISRARPPGSGCSRSGGGCWSRALCPGCSRRRNWRWSGNSGHPAHPGFQTWLKIEKEHLHYNHVVIEKHIEHSHYIFIEKKTIDQLHYNKDSLDNILHCIFYLPKKNHNSYNNIKNPTKTNLILFARWTSKPGSNWSLWNRIVPSFELIE